jgi:nucleotide-binding universal stress UspA family protein
MQTLRHLVCGTDFSDCAEQALEIAISVAFAASAQITLVHVCELGISDVDEQRLVQCRELLSDVLERHRHNHIEISGVLRCGKPWEKLNNVAIEVGANLIVIGRHGGGRGQSIPIGSVAEHLVRSANRPVLTVVCDADRPRSSETRPS